MSEEWNVSDIKRKFGDASFFSGFSGEVLKTGSFVVDALTGIGGIPIGHIVEIFGAEGCGKTTLALSIVKQALNNGKYVLYEDYESTVSSAYLEKLGVDANMLKDYRVTPKTMEDGFTMMKLFCEDERHRGGIIIVDSLAAMPPEFDVDKAEEKIGQSKVAASASVMSIALKQLTGILARAEVSLIFVNQERSNIDLRGMGFGKISTGGKALRFYSAIRIQMENKGSIVYDEPNLFDEEFKKKKVVSALRVSVKVIKNKFAPSYREGEIVVRMDEGIDNIYSLLVVAQNSGLITKSSRGAYYELPEKYSGDAAGRKKIHGFEKLRNYFLSDKRYVDMLSEDVLGFINSKEKLNESGDGED